MTEGEARTARIPEPIRELTRDEVGQEKEYLPSRIEILRGNDVTFQFLSVGCVVRVGCKSIAFTTAEEALSEFNDFVKDPQKSWKKWTEIFKQNE